MYPKLDDGMGLKIKALHKKLYFLFVKLASVPQVCCVPGAPNLGTAWELWPFSPQILRAEEPAAIYLLHSPFTRSWKA